MKNLKKESILVFSLVGLAVASRLLPHTPNFAPITGIAFLQLQIFKKMVGLSSSFILFFITDLILGLSWINLFVYGAFALISLIGMTQKRIAFPSVLAGSLLFFVVSNLGVWLLHYPLTVEGLASCFTLAIPFFGNTLAGDLFYTAMFFYTFSTLKKTYLKRLKF